MYQLLIMPLGFHRTLHSYTALLNRKVNLNLFCKYNECGMENEPPPGKN